MTEEDNVRYNFSDIPPVCSIKYALKLCITIDFWVIAAKSILTG